VAEQKPFGIPIWSRDHKLFESFTGRFPVKTYA
jgi:hypothetical protein